MPIRVGIIGLSAQQDACTSSAHIGPLRANLSPEYTVTAVATSSPASAAAAAKQWGLPASKAYSSAEAIAHDPDVDLVVVGVKLPVHKELALPALKAGKDSLWNGPLQMGKRI
jgi:predicted dehydrogenase